jgi:hypothetical protein
VDKRTLQLTLVYEPRLISGRGFFYAKEILKPFLMMIKSLTIAEDNKLACDQQENQKVVPVLIINSLGFGIAGFLQIVKTVKSISHFK